MYPSTQSLLVFVMSHNRSRDEERLRDKQRFRDNKE